MIMSIKTLMVHEDMKLKTSMVYKDEDMKFKYLEIIYITTRKWRRK